MAITLPALSRFDQIEFSEVEFGGYLKSTLGGPTQRVKRPGGRLSVSVDLRPMNETCARQWLGARMRSKAEGETLRLILRQNGPGISGISGSGAVNASVISASGSGIKVGQIFSFIAGGHAYLHMVTNVAGGSVNIAPSLRANMSGHPLDFMTPTIEGFIESPTAWSLTQLKHFGQSFVLIEDR